MSALIGNPLLLTSAPAADDDSYKIEKSLRFNEADSPSLKRNTPLGNRRTWTWSGWIKRSEVDTSGHAYLFGSWEDGNNATRCMWATQDQKLQFYQKIGGTVAADFKTNAIHRDPGAWMHVVVAYDSPNATESERVKIYVNGEKQALTQTTAIPQNQESWINKSGEDFWNGALNDGSHKSLKGYLADVQFIDGLALAPAAFGSFDSTGVWNPKAFVLPAPNDGTTWSSYGTWSGDSSTDRPNAFDGSLSTYHEASSNNTNMIWTPTSGLPIKTSLRLYLDVNGTHNTIKINDKEVLNHTDTSDGWNDVPGAGITITSLDKLDIRKGGSSYAKLAAIEIDGVILIDGQTDASLTTNNPHNGTVWSSFCTSSSGGTSPGSFQDLFSGSGGAGTGEDGFKCKPNSDGHTCTFIPSTAITGTKIEIRAYCEGTKSATNLLEVNGTSKFEAVQTAGGNANAAFRWVDVGTSIDTTNGVKWGRQNATNETCITAIRVDGHILRDACQSGGGGRNGFHLKFNDTSLNRYLGKDSLNGKLADATGGKPIYNCTDDYGDVKGSINTGDANKASLKLAVPLSGDYKSYHGTANGNSGNDITPSTSGVSNDTTQSRFYGSSTKFDSGKVEFTASNDYDFDGDFCIEVWLRKTSNTNKQIICDGRSGGSTGYMLWVNDSGTIKLSLDSDESAEVIAGSTNINNNKWYHVAVTRSGSGSNNVKMFLNGVNIGQATNTSSLAAGAIKIGERQQGTSMANFVGNMQDFRLYKGTAKYTANFTPPTRNDFAVNNLLHDSRGLNIRYYHDDSNTSFDSNSPSGDLSAVASKWITNPAKHTNNTGYGTNQNGVTAVFAPGGQGGSGTATFTFTGKDQVYLASSTNGGASWSGTGEKRQIYSGGDDYEYQISNVNAVAWAGGSSDNWTQVVLSSMSSSEQEPGKDIDSLTDSPTNYGTDEGAGGEVRGNYATLNPLDTGGGGTASNGNLDFTTSGAGGARSTIGMSSGKWYSEVTLGHGSLTVGITKGGTAIDSYIGSNADEYSYGQNGLKIDSSAQVSYGDTFTTGDTIGVAFDADGGNLYFYKNGTVQDSGTAAFTGLTDGPYFFAAGNNATTNACTFNFGQRAFKNTAPSGYTALCTQNLDNTFDSEDSENNPSKYFDITTYKGDDQATRTIAGAFGFAPDLIWAKNRTVGNNHGVYDRIRGDGNRLHPDGDNPENTDHGLYGFVEAGTADGSIDIIDGSDGTYNMNSDGDNIVVWAWDAGTGSTSTNNSGSNNATIACDYLVNTTPGFSIAKYTGTDDGSGTNNIKYVYHGLNAAPDFVIIKGLGSRSWIVKHKDHSSTKNQFLDDTHAETQWGSGYIGDLGGTNANTIVPLHQKDSYDPINLMGDGEDYIMYSWTAIPGYSAFGKYTGNGASGWPNADGVFVYTGFSPRYLLIKNIDDSENWVIMDIERSPYNYANKKLVANSSAAEVDPANNHEIDFLSNGFKLKNNTGELNANGKDYIYCAFASSPFKTARAQ